MTIPQQASVLRSSLKRHSPEELVENNIYRPSNKIEFNTCTIVDTSLESSKDLSSPDIKSFRPNTTQVEAQPKCCSHQRDISRPEKPPLTQSPPQYYREKSVKPKGVPFDKFSLTSGESAAVSEQKHPDGICLDSSSHKPSKAFFVNIRFREKSAEKVRLSQDGLIKPILTVSPVNHNNALQIEILSNQQHHVTSEQLLSRSQKKHHKMPPEHSYVTPQQQTTGTSVDATMNNIPTLVNEIVSNDSNPSIYPSLHTQCDVSFQDNACFNNVGNTSQNKALCTIGNKSILKGHKPTAPVAATGKFFRRYSSKYCQKPLSGTPYCRVTTEMSQTPRKGTITLAGFDSAATDAGESCGFNLQREESPCHSYSDDWSDNWFENLDSMPATPKRNLRLRSTLSSMESKSSSSTPLLEDRCVGTFAQNENCCWNFDEDQVYEAREEEEEEEEEEENCCDFQTDDSRDYFDASLTQKKNSKFAQEFSNNHWCESDSHRVGVDPSTGINELRVKSGRKQFQPQDLASDDARNSQDSTQTGCTREERGSRRNQNRSRASVNMLPPLSRRQIGLPHKEKIRRHY